MRKLKLDYIKQRLSSTVSSKDLYRAASQQVGWHKNGTPVLLIVNGDLTNKGESMAQEMNDKKVEKIEESIPATEKNPLNYTKDFLKDKTIPKLTIGHVSREGVEWIICKLDNSEVTGHDDISTNALKMLAPAIIPSLTHLIN